jgi:hypothetical protein
VSAGARQIIPQSRVCYDRSGELPEQLRFDGPSVLQVRSKLLYPKCTHESVMVPLLAFGAT